MTDSPNVNNDTPNVPSENVPSEAPISPERALAARVEALKTQVQDALKDPLKAKKALEALGRSKGLPTGSTLTKQLTALRKSSLTVLGLEDERVALVQALDEHIEARKMDLRMVFLNRLNAAARTENVELIKLGESPLSYFMFPFVVEIDFEAEKASLLYAREPVMEAPLEAARVLKARDTGMDMIKKQAVPSSEFFDLLKQAYEMTLISRNEQPGARVDLVDLLVPLAVLSAGRTRWRKQGITGISDYPRYLLAYQLQRLRRDSMLEKAGTRIDLGTATGGSTKNKQDVLFLPTSQGEGQYYLSLRFA